VGLSDFLLAAVHSPHDSSIRAMAQASARTAYVAMCLALAWGVFAATGWIGRLSGRRATRVGHITLALFAIVLGTLHAAAFVFLTDPDEVFVPSTLLNPVSSAGKLRWSLGIVGLELVIAVLLTSLLRRFFIYRRWLNVHRVAYVAVALIVVHSWLGAFANGNLSLLWLAGVTVLVPTILVTVLRFVSPRKLVSLGLLGD
jgi:sulfoxide reductase heme-binding subunit YedZ